MSAWRYLGFAAVIGGALAMAGGADAAPVLYNTQTQVVRYSHAALSPRQAKVFDWFRHQPLYFGAFEIDRASGKGFGVRGYNRLQDAIKAAHAACGAESGHSCTLYATLTPEGFRARVSGRDGLGLGGQFYYRNQYLPNLTQGSYGAFAVSDLADGGASWRQPTRAQARAVALDHCRARVGHFLADVPAMVGTAYRRAGLGHCWVVETRGG